MPYEIIEHTADLKILVRGNSLENLFSEAMRAMMELIKAKTEGISVQERTIEIQSPDETSLLVDFLSETLALSQTNKEIYTEVSFAEFTSTKIQGKLKGVKVDSFDEDIKAVTYHEANVGRNDKGEWETIVIFDI